MSIDLRIVLQSRASNVGEAQAWVPFQLRVGIERLAFLTFREAVSCIFPVLIFLTLAVTKVVSIPGLHRYDLILVACLLTQAGMYLTGLESRDELKVIGVFHLLGIALELFAVYGNFFTHHWRPDIRRGLTAAIFVVFLRTRVSFQAPNTRLWMPLPLAFFPIGRFVWFAENIATFFNAWQYLSQADDWRMVHVQKLSSWFLLVIISFIATLKHVKEERGRLPE